ncbi:hypothetical protein MAR_024643 [Mya arenaria]|uniref:Pacifastin domain-containing protein n=1 Tax=Mya arenaria TaxID=6604 RepID=A0ABY7DVE3_MYAAR|nr:hypothetical protein MAR_024643 [Mya arenaria]
MDGLGQETKTICPEDTFFKHVTAQTTLVDVYGPARATVMVATHASVDLTDSRPPAPGVSVLVFQAMVFPSTRSFQAMAFPSDRSAPEQEDIDQDNRQGNTNYLPRRHFPQTRYCTDYRGRLVSPGQSYSDGCNTCIQPTAPGVSVVVFQAMVLPSTRSALEQEDIDQDNSYCTDYRGRLVSPGQSYSDGCNTCMCGSYGQPTYCTQRFCGGLPSHGLPVHQVLPSHGLPIRQPTYCTQRFCGGVQSHGLPVHQVLPSHGLPVHQGQEPVTCLEDIIRKYVTAQTTLVDVYGPARATVMVATHVPVDLTDSRLSAPCVFVVVFKTMAFLSDRSAPDQEDIDQDNSECVKTHHLYLSKDR